MPALINTAVAQNDNFREGSLSWRIARQARAIAGKRARQITDNCWALAIGDQLETWFGAPSMMVRTVLDTLTVTPSELMHRDDCEIVLNGICFAIEDGLTAARGSIH